MDLQWVCIKSFQALLALDYFPNLCRQTGNENHIPVIELT
jgi:hypothetical protein